MSGPVKTVPESYTSLDFKEITISHVPPESPAATPVVVLALNRPNKYNAVTGQMLTEIEAAYNLFSQDSRLKAIVLTGTGKAFCAGADLGNGFSGLIAQKKSEEGLNSFRDQGGRVALAISNSIQPTIVAINGPAAGFGLTVTLPATIRVAWKDAKVAVPFARRGLTMESCSAFYLPRLIGLSNTLHLTTTGSTFLASDPLVAGLFSKLLPTPEATISHAIELAQDIAANTSPVSTKLMRDLIVHGPATPEAAHILDSRVFISVVGSQDNVEGMKSFLEKRKPQFNGTLTTKDFPFWPWWGDSSLKVKALSKL
ncbi:hypothetical protein LTR20_007374 [Exophiala xenobiotica]|nr:hypothetical protein LTS06_008031 [Exophiala xenobiotica]KAK5283493.1 hypothetical protein LTR40_001636 [Exophiala xenobiotica]KAK5367234.1 hypothetical protein LTS13_008087 [Exophiala xenobiotica]KAK5401237.1 hypothetical protein LTR79_001756 [Exophiala xenobiotica]KAK5405946.1 hypothetical protein LTR90_010757 [Exophiala xenobiotica]